MPRPNRKTALRDLKTYGRSHAVRLQEYDYASDADIHIVLCARDGAPFRDASFAAFICENVEFYAKRVGYRLYGYCLMPDHLHLLIIGLKSSSDQLKLTKQLRRELNKLLHPYRLQSQAHDHVLREKELEKTAFQGIAYYIQQNPVRKNLSQDWKDYPFTKCMIPGYFDLNPRNKDYWNLFWRIHNKLVA